MMAKKLILRELVYLCQELVTVIYYELTEEMYPDWYTAEEGVEFWCWVENLDAKYEKIIKSRNSHDMKIIEQKMTNDLKKYHKDIIRLCPSYCFHKGTLKKLKLLEGDE